MCYAMLPAVHGQSPETLAIGWVLLARRMTPQVDHCQLVAINLNYLFDTTVPFAR